jgi:hypothetical protein
MWILQTDSRGFGEGKNVIWDEIDYYDKADLVKVNATPNLQPYCEGTMVPEVVSFRNQGKVTIFQQENTLPHTAEHTKEVLRQSNIDALK